MALPGIREHGRERPLAPGVAQGLLDRQQGAWADPEDFDRLEAFPELSLVEVRDLPPLERLVVLAVCWGDLPLPAVAQVLHRDTRTVTKAWRRGLERIREVMLARMADAPSTAVAVEGSSARR